MTPQSARSATTTTRQKSPEAIARWNRSEKGKAAAERYRQSPEAKAKRKAYRARKYQLDKLKTLEGQIGKLGYIALLRARGCDVCGLHETPDNGETLQWHHLDPSAPKVRVSQMKTRSYEAIDDETSRCALLCEQCHRNAHKLLRMQARAAAKAAS